jgi:peptide/nickel transport system ATP-binding protein
VSEESNSTILNVTDLKMYFPVTRGLLKRKVADVKAVDGVTFGLRKGETLGLVGESGCGKTTVGRCIIRLYQPTSGRILFLDDDITTAREEEMKEVRAKIALIFQDPYSSLDPRQSAGSIVGEPLRIHSIVKEDSEYSDRVDRLSSPVQRRPEAAHRSGEGARERALPHRVRRADLGP